MDARRRSHLDDAERHLEHVLARAAVLARFGVRPNRCLQVADAVLEASEVTVAHLCEKNPPLQSARRVRTPCCLDIAREKAPHPNRFFDQVGQVPLEFNLEAIESRLRFVLALFDPRFVERFERSAVHSPGMLFVPRLGLRVRHFAFCECFLEVTVDEVRLFVQARVESRGFDGREREGESRTGE